MGLGLGLRLVCPDVEGLGVVWCVGGSTQEVLIDLLDLVCGDGGSEEVHVVGCRSESAWVLSFEPGVYTLHLAFELLHTH